MKLLIENSKWQPVEYKCRTCGVVLGESGLNRHQSNTDHKEFIKLRKKKK